MHQLSQDHQDVSLKLSETTLEADAAWTAAARIRDEAHLAIERVGWGGGGGGLEETTGIEARVTRK